MNNTYVVKSMRSKRWSQNEKFTPLIIRPNSIQKAFIPPITSSNSHTYYNQYCEVLSSVYLPKNTKVKLYLDRDLKRTSHMYDQDEIQADYEKCKQSIIQAFGADCWNTVACSSRHGYNKDKKKYCISFHFVLNAFCIQYIHIPELLKSKGLNELFDLNVYKESEQLWQVPWCVKTHTDQRILKPMNFVHALHMHLIHCLVDSEDLVDLSLSSISTPTPTSTYSVSKSTSLTSPHPSIKATPRDELWNQFVKTSTPDPILTARVSKQELINKEKQVSDLLKRKHGDVQSTCTRCQIRSNGNNVSVNYLFKNNPKSGRTCYVTENEKHISNNFVLNLCVYQNQIQVYYKCFSSECIHKKAKLLGDLKVD